jgi:hypothetical protein
MAESNGASLFQTSRYLSIVDGDPDSVQLRKLILGKNSRAPKAYPHGSGNHQLVRDAWRTHRTFWGLEYQDGKLNTHIDIETMSRIRSIFTQGGIEEHSTIIKPPRHIHNPWKRSRPYPSQYGQSHPKPSRSIHTSISPNPRSEKPTITPQRHSPYSLSSQLRHLFYHHPIQQKKTSS